MQCLRVQEVRIERWASGLEMLRVGELGCCMDAYTLQAELGHGHD